MTFHDLPVLNASLNGTSTLLLLSGYVLIKLNKVRGHTWCMIAAVVTSTLFLASYLTYHYVAGEKSSGLKPGTLRAVYFSILFPHLLLSIVMLPMIFTTLFRAYRKDWLRHRRIAVWTFPIWLYVSVTGVIIYWMLYHYIPAHRG